MPCTYVPWSENAAKIYVSSSREDFAQTRLKAHNQGRTRSTKFGISWKIVHEERFITYTEARKRENFLKSGVGRKWIHDHFKNQITRRDG